MNCVRPYLSALTVRAECAIARFAYDQCSNSPTVVISMLRARLVSILTGAGWPSTVLEQAAQFGSMFHGKRHPKDVRAAEGEQFLTHRAVHRPAGWARITVLSWTTSSGSMTSPFRICYDCLPAFNQAHCIGNGDVAKPGCGPHRRRPPLPSTRSRSARSSQGHSCRSPWRSWRLSLSAIPSS